MSARAKRIQGDRAFYIFNNILLSVALLVVLYPLLFILSSSFSSPAAVSAGKVWLWPVDLSLAGYNAVFRNQNILNGYLNTTIYTFAGTAFDVALTLIAAYPLSRKDLRGKNIFMFLFAFTMLFNGGLIPNYMLVYNLGMVNTRWAMIIPFALSAYNVIITRTYYQSNIPDELLEAAQLDGCSDFKFMFHVVVPLSGAITAVITLFYAVGHWNSFFNAFIFLSDAKLQPLQIILREILVLNTIDLKMTSFETQTAKMGLRELLKYSLIIVASVPIICMYPFVQKYFVKGVMIGAIKG